jgi:hypothetical protein
VNGGLANGPDARDSILNYSDSCAQPPEQLTLEEGVGHVRIIFPVLPTWAYLLPVGVEIAAALMKTIVPFWLGYTIWGLYRVGGQPSSAIKAQLWHMALVIAMPLWAAAFFWWLCAILTWRRYRRWGRIPKILTMSNEGLELSYLGWRGMRHEHWSASEITAIELQPVRGNVTWWKTAADLRFLRASGRPLHFRLSSSDSQLPGKIAERVQSMLGVDSQVADAH